MISFSIRSKDESLETFLGGMEKINDFHSVFQAACYYSFKHVENSYVVGTVDADIRLFEKVIKWIYNQSEGNIEIKILKTEEAPISTTKKCLRYLFSMYISDAYTPLAKYIAFYLALITLRMCDCSERFTNFLTEEELEFNSEVFSKINGNALSSFIYGHTIFCLTNSKGQNVTIPKEVYDGMFNVELFNRSYSSSFYEYSSFPTSRPFAVALHIRLSQTACMLRLCREMHLLEKLTEINNKASDSKSYILEDFDYIGQNKLNLKEPLYYSPQEKFNLTNILDQNLKNLPDTRKIKVETNSTDEPPFDEDYIEDEEDFEEEIEQDI